MHLSSVDIPTKALTERVLRRAEAEAKLSELARQQESAITAELKRRNDLDAASAQVRAVPSNRVVTVMMNVDT